MMLDYIIIEKCMQFNKMLGYLLVLICPHVLHKTLCSRILHEVLGSNLHSKLKSSTYYY